ncbi:MAG: histidine--tRNA ligase [Candidatus Omnitrophica bacterium]|nr:histidine--tRNA ligase [Candidatus Omnitrophota bacterium]
MFKSVRGTKDILPKDSFRWQRIEEASRKIFSIYGYKEIRTPLIEEASLFVRSLGDNTEIVSKQMFKVVRNLGEESKREIVLRPEGTASVVRAYLESGLYKREGIARFYYLGPMFRAERPQKGRLRQFHHIGAEAIGSYSPYLDVEIISLADRLLKELGIKEYRVNLNTLGCNRDKVKFKELLKEKLKPNLSYFCSNCKIRFQYNPLRILDCKNKNCREVVSGLSLKDEYLCSECKQHFQDVKEGLKNIGIDYEILPWLVRGLDYYTRTVFEITCKNLGSQDALGAGGRYDNLVKQLGGPEKGAVGFALGVERIILVEEKEPVSQQDYIYLISLGKEATIKTLKLLETLRKEGIHAVSDYLDRSLKVSLRRANQSGAKFVIIIGEDEIKKGVMILKDMSSGRQKELKEEDLIEELKNIKINNLRC